MKTVLGPLIFSCSRHWKELVFCQIPPLMQVAVENNLRNGWQSALLSILSCKREYISCKHVSYSVYNSIHTVSDTTVTILYTQFNNEEQKEVRRV